MPNKRLHEALARELPCDDADLDEVCVSFYPTLNLEFFNEAAHCANRSCQMSKTPNSKVGFQSLDEHELALAG